MMSQAVMATCGKTIDPKNVFSPTRPLRKVHCFKRVFNTRSQLVACSKFSQTYPL
jgi:hypothetical protein